MDLWIPGPRPHCAVFLVLVLRGGVPRRIYPPSGLGLGWVGSAKGPCGCCNPMLHCAVFLVSGLRVGGPAMSCTFPPPHTHTPSPCQKQVLDDDDARFLLADLAR